MVASGGAVSVGVGGPGRGCMAVGPVVVLGLGVGVAGTKVIGFRSPVVGVVVGVCGR